MAIPYSRTIVGGLPGYSALIVLGILAAIWLAGREDSRLGLPEDTAVDLALAAVPCGIVGARLYYVLMSWERFAADPVRILYIWEGGIAIYGGVIGAIIGMWAICKYKKIKLTAVLDLILMVFLLGQSIGRWGNFMNREAFGAATDSFFRMGLFNEKTQMWEYYHPTFLYESLWNLIGFVLLAVLARKRKYDGQVALGYAAWYGLGRAFIEGLRVDSLWWGPFRVSQLLAAVTCITATAVLIWQHFKPHDPANLYVNKIAAGETTEE